ncbi:uncharacterized protein LOC127756470 [Oryza glaberrima]|uniref:uncharacterized protein LOC127756470 n=1 Tax=Oryza glaberrima TaxID=4538 RepID=UPI00224C5113|nr:uncharacterized protein LOC127756470 [Oryza glaberrima]
MSSCEAATLEGFQPRMPLAVKRARIRRESNPGWVMLDCRVGDMSGDDDLGAITMAKGTTSTGDGITVAFSAAAPPAISRLLFTLHPNKNRQTTDSDSDSDSSDSDTDESDSSARGRVIAAHGNSVLLSCIFNVRDPITPYVASLREELFIYQPAGAVDLTRLPPCYHGIINIDGSRNTGILCRNNGEFVVAHLGGMTSVGDYGGSGPPIPRPVAAELCKYAGGFWGTNWLRIHHAAGEDQDLCWWETDLVVPFGDSLCWVDYLRGILLCDVFSPIPDFRYVRLPVNPYPGSCDQELAMRGSMHMYRSVCVTKNGGMKFVDVASEDTWFSAGNDIESCPTPFTITSWTLTSDRLSWIKDASLDSNVFSSLASNEHLPQIVPEFPLVDMEDPNVIYFTLPLEEGSNDKAAFVALDMVRRTLGLRNTYTLRSTLKPGDDNSSTTSCNLFGNEPFLPFEFSNYLNLDAAYNRGTRSSIAVIQPAGWHRVVMAYAVMRRAVELGTMRAALKAQKPTTRRKTIRPFTLQAPVVGS